MRTLVRDEPSTQRKKENVIENILFFFFFVCVFVCGMESGVAFSCLETLVKIDSVRRVQRLLRSVLSSEQNFLVKMECVVNGSEGVILVEGMAWPGVQAIPGREGKA